MVQLYLVGTNHSDLNGPERLEKFLRLVRPDIIGLEAMVEGYQKIIYYNEQFKSQMFRSDLIREYGPETAENMVKFLNMLGYEVWVPNKFSRENDEVKLICCDKFKEDDLKVLIKRSFWTDITMDKIAKLDLAEVQKAADDSYENFSVAELQTELQDDQDLFKRILHDRDETAEQKIRRAFSDTNHSLVYVGGIMHFFGEYPNLYERLKDLSPNRIKLPEVDKL